ncbi:MULTISPECIES: DUF6920 family protein [unclassified Microcoleus]|uniref:DUF6920 family protein n=1 Tax=unclassified Microcoleus TaxID=2642155 RepID=UPI002FD3878E
MTKIPEISLDDLWESAPKSDRPFNPESLINLPNLARRYLENAIAPGTPLASAVRLWMHGEIKLDQKWHPFKGEEVIYGDRGMIWRATTWAKGLPIWGGDRWGNPEGEAFHYVDFGGIVEQSSTFDGYTIPTHLRVGWFLGSDRFESEGEFFRCAIDKAIYQ